MSQENLQTMIMQNFGGGVKEVYYGIVQVVNGAACLYHLVLFTLQLNMV